MTWWTQTGLAALVAAAPAMVLIEGSGTAAVAGQGVTAPLPAGPPHPGTEHLLQPAHPATFDAARQTDSVSDPSPPSAPPDSAAAHWRTRRPRLFRAPVIAATAAVVVVATAAAVYAAMPLVHDMIGLYFAVGNANHLPPWGGIDMLLSTNPIAVAVPALEEPPLVLDMATTVAAYGKVKVAAQQGKTMPEGWMIDREGQPLTDPNRADDGFLLPIGGYKGAALALMFGLLAGTLNGAANGADVVDFNKDDTTPTNTGQATPWPRTRLRRCRPEHRRIAGR